jgi:hypothetical protein
MAYQRGSLKKVMKKEGLTWVLVIVSEEGSRRRS